MNCKGGRKNIVNIFKRIKEIEESIKNIHNVLLSDIKKLEQDNRQLRRIMEHNVCGQITGSYVNTTQDPSKELMKKCDLYLYKDGKEYIYRDFTFHRLYNTNYLKIEINNIKGSEHLALIKVFHFDKFACSYCVDLDTQQYIRTDGRVEICSSENINEESKN